MEDKFSIENIDPAQLEEFNRIMGYFKSNPEGVQIYSLLLELSPPFTFLFKALQIIDTVPNRYENHIFPGARSKKEQLTAELDDDAFSELKEIIGFENRKDEYEFEPVRNGYVELYHKVENLHVELIKILNQAHGVHHSEKSGSEKKSLLKHGIDLERMKLYSEVEKVRLIANSVKHTNSIPKQGLSEFYPNWDMSKPIRISQEDFLNDCGLIRKYVIGLGMLGMVTGMPSLFQRFNKEGQEMAMTDWKKKYPVHKAQVEKLHYK